MKVSDPFGANMSTYDKIQKFLFTFIPEGLFLETKHLFACHDNAYSYPTSFGQKYDNFSFLCKQMD